jgi:hypothetical protein
MKGIYTMNHKAPAFLLTLLIAFIVLVSACDNNSTETANTNPSAVSSPASQSTNSRTSLPNASTKPAPVPTYDKDELTRQTILAAADSKITYEQLKKNADRYTGEPWAFTGRVFQIQESGGQTSALVSLDAWGNKIVAVRADFTTDFVEKDQVYVVGHLAGDYSYTSVAQWSVTVPAIEASAILKPSEAARLKAGKKLSGGIAPKP